MELRLICTTQNEKAHVAGEADRLGEDIGEIASCLLH